MSSLLPLADTGVQKALKLGADEVEIYIFEGENVEVTLESNDVHNARSDVKSGVGIRVFKDKGLGFASVNSIDEKAIEQAIERALRLSSHAPSEPWNELPEKAPLKTTEGIYDSSIEEFGTGEALEKALEMLSSAKETDERITIESGTFSVGRGEDAIASSRGVEAWERSGAILYYLSGMAIDGDEVSNMDYSMRFTHHPDRVDVSEVSREFSERVISSLGAKGVKSFEGDVIFGPNASRLLLGSVLSYSVNSDNIQKGMSKFSGLLRSKVASDGLTIVDDGLQEDGYATSSFDREGIPHKPIRLIDDGELKAFIYNNKTARKEGVESTGHASGDESHPPSIGTTNFIIESGDISYDEIVEDMRMGLVVRRLAGFPDPVSGDFSAVVKGGFLIENGEVLHPVTNTMITGNVFDMITNVQAISKEAERVMSFTLPYLQIGGISVTGK